MADEALSERGVEAAADYLYAVGHHHGWWGSIPQPLASWRDLGPIGRSEFGGIVEQTIRAYLKGQSG